jgi:hypothetical protein
LAEGDIGMAKARSKTPVTDSLSFPSILEHKEHLDALSDRLARHPNRELIRDAFALTFSHLRILILRESIARKKQALAELRGATAVQDAQKEAFGVCERALKTCLQAELERINSRRTMAQEGIETAEAYLRLKEKHPKDVAALQALVQLSSERGKQYAIKYSKSRDLEPVRQYIKSKMRMYRKHKEKMEFLEILKTKR